MEKRFIKIEDNEDGTCTLEIYIGPEYQDEKLAAVVEMPFDEILAGYIQQLNEFGAPFDLDGKITEIPNTLESL